MTLINKLYILKFWPINDCTSTFKIGKQVEGPNKPQEGWGWGLGGERVEKGCLFNTWEYNVYL